MNREQSDTEVSGSLGAHPTRDRAGDLYEAFRVEIDTGKDSIRVVPVGELDMGTVGELNGHLEEILTSDSNELILDLGQLAFIDSSGLQLILEWIDRAREARLAFRLIQGGPAVQRVFELSGMNGQLPIESA